jgi:hypothetical protein
MILDFLKKKKNKVDDFPTEITTELPEDLERFRTREEPIPVRERYPKPMGFEEPMRKSESQDKSDLILQKLETIDVRLKLLEEKLGV